MDGPSTPWEAAARLFEPPTPKTRRWASPLDMAQELDPTIVRTPALELINRSLVDLAEGREDRLIISMPPQEAKSTTAAYRFPTWLLSQVDADLRLIIISYADEIARRWGAEIKRDFESYDGTDGSTDLGVRLRADSRAAGRWQVEGRRGGVYCAGVAGSVTGRPADCLHGDTEIVTPNGYVPVRELCRPGVQRPVVLSFNHNAGRAEWRPVVATRVIQDRPLVEVITESGRRIICTPDHRFYVNGRGYVGADALRPGDGLRVAGTRAGSVQSLRQDADEAPDHDQPRQAGDTAVLLEGVPVRLGMADPDLRGLREVVPQGPVRGGEGEAEGLPANLLRPPVLPRLADAERGNAGSGGNPCGPLGSDSDGHFPHEHWPEALHRPRGTGDVGRGASQAGVRVLRRRPQKHVAAVPAVLPGRAGVNLPDAVLRPVRNRLPQDARRAREAATQWPEQAVLLARLRGAGAEVGRMAMHELWRPDRLETSGPVLLPSVQSADAGTSQAGVGTEALHSVRAAVPAEKFAEPVLRQGLRGHGALGSDGRHRQLEVQGRQQLRQGVQADAAADYGAGRKSVPGVRPAGRVHYGSVGRPHSAPFDPCGASLERAAPGQLSGEPDRSVPAVPHAAPQVDYDAVRVVRKLHGARDSVYDLQVEGNRNFFAGEVLVHNCIIIDDPIKDLEQAQSSKYRERFQRFWQGVAVPRLGPGARACVIQTRWHEEDAAGWLIQTEGRREQGGRWRVLNIPAIAESDDDPLGRAIGEPMISARGARDWNAIRRSVGEYVWASLYMGRPAPVEGGLFKRLWWRYWSPAPQLGMSSPRLTLGPNTHLLGDCWRFATMDLAASTRTSADWTVAAAWALAPSGDLILLDRVRGKVGEAQHFDLVRPLVERWQLDTVFVEASQHETTLVREATRSGVPVSPLQAETDKFSRALPASAKVSAGNVWLPAGATWLTEWLDEMSSFPNSAHDDQVDCLSWAVRVAVTKWSPVGGSVDPLAQYRKADAEPDFFSMQF